MLADFKTVPLKLSHQCKKWKNNDPAEIPFQKYNKKNIPICFKYITSYFQTDTDN